MKTVTLCADDFALNEAVSRGIVELAVAGRLSAVSCMSASRHWHEHAAWLAPLHDRIDIGLHLTLTGLAPLGPMPQLAAEGMLPALGKVLSDGVMHRLPRQEIAAELRRQMAAFIEQTGRVPDFIDGHQHVHLLPGVRETVFELWEEYLKPGQGYLRSCYEPLGAILGRGVEPVKALVISTLSMQLARRAKNKGVIINDSFRGVHDFSGKVSPQQLFPRFLKGGGSHPLIMCHPGHATAGTDDELRDWRPREYAYFSSEQFLADVRAAGLTLGRLPRHIA
jgi:predicted glycoside hydrolase/deacetylase ChbG (UPF0249 family)